MRKRLTVAIPLHRALRWVDEIAGNVTRLPPWARIVLSDISQDDDAIDVLARRFRRDPRVKVRRRNSGEGWRDHVNQLIKGVRTQYFAILAQDDTIDDGYYEQLVDALDSKPGAGLAFGPLEAYTHTGEEVHHPSPPFSLGERPPWMEALDLDLRWNLGVPYRGVVRSRLLAPVPATPDDRFADAMWVFSLALVAHLVEVPAARYTKRYHPDNTHSAWAPLEGEERLDALRVEINRRFRDIPEVRAAAVARLEARFLQA